MLIDFRLIYNTHNPNFNCSEFDTFRIQAGLPNFEMRLTEWIEKTNAMNQSHLILIIVPFGMAQIPDMLFATGCSMSPTMVALYKEQLQVGGVIQRSLVEFCKYLNEQQKEFFLLQHKGENND